MKAIVKTVFVVSANDKKQEKDTMQEAQEVKGFLEEFLTFHLQLKNIKRLYID